jgi:hypothetical protein
MFLSNNRFKKGIIMVMENKPKRMERILKIIFNTAYFQYPRAKERI